MQSTNVRSSILQLASLKNQEAAQGMVDATSEDDVKLSQGNDIAQLKSNALTGISDLITPTDKVARQQQFDDIAAKEGTAGPSVTQARLRKLDSDVARELEREVDALNRHRDELAKLRQDVDAAQPGRVPAPLAQELSALENLTLEEVLTGGSNNTEKRRRDLTQQLQQALGGAASS